MDSHSVSERFNQHDHKLQTIENKLEHILTQIDMITLR